MISIIFTENITDKIYNPNDNWDCYMRVGYAGLSTDDKPISAIEENKPNYLVGNSSIFYEMDTGNEYFFDQNTETWILSDGTGGSTMALFINLDVSTGALDKTCQEILDAVTSGKVVYMIVPETTEDFGKGVYNLSYIMNSEPYTIIFFNDYVFVVSSVDSYPVFDNGNSLN